MQAALERERGRGAAGVRLVQAAYHNRTMALYASLGFDVREPLSCMQGPNPDPQRSGLRRAAGAAGGPGRLLRRGPGGCTASSAGGSWSR